MRSPSRATSSLKVNSARRKEPFAAAQRIEAVAAIETPERPAAWSPSYWDRFNICLAEREIADFDLSLEVAMEMARRMAATARDSDERGAALVLLGNALRMLGERESGTARLGDAVAAYREALLENTRARVPLQWAATQMNLAVALKLAGDRESGTARLSEAVAAYREALQEWTRERMPRDWAATKRIPAPRSRRWASGKGGTARLAEAAAAYRDALREQTRERGPLQWAATQVNLGNVLMLLGERESGTARLEIAAAAFHEALKESTRERAPVRWAAAHSISPRCPSPCSPRPRTRTISTMRSKGLAAPWRKPKAADLVEKAEQLRATPRFVRFRGSIGQKRFTRNVLGRFRRKPYTAEDSSSHLVRSAPSDVRLRSMRAAHPSPTRRRRLEFAIHLTAGIIGEADSVLSRMHRLRRRERSSRP